MAEETILLCNRKENADEQGVKVIALKEIAIDERTEQSETNKQNALEAEYVSLKARIDDAKRVLKKIEEKRIEMIRDIQRDVQIEKEKWEEEKRTLIEEAKETGYQAGYEQGKNEAIEQYNALIAEANELVDMAKKDYDAIVKKYEEAIVQLAIAAAEKIIHTEIGKDASHYVSIVQQAIEELQDRTELKVYVHPDDYPFIMKQKSEIEQLLEDDETLSIYMDPQLIRGDCFIKHPYGQLDVSIDSQLQQLKQALEQYVLENSS